MCGICGKIDLTGKAVPQALLRSMTESFAYRGPDDEGFFFEGPVGLGHRRLSIIDLSPSGRQPMSNEDQTLWLVFNGEIYDFAETRKELVSRGHTLKSHTDTETVLHLYEEEGVACLKHLNGMFGFALWDARLQRLWLARDRLGKKPLVYYWDGKRLLFASEIKAILRDPEVPREIDFEALDLYLTLNYIPATWTIFKNIRKLLPGHYLLLEKGKLSIQSYWDIPVNGGEPEVPSPSDPVQWNQCKERLRALLDASVRRRLIADVPLGAFLSGGIDSSIIVALMARHSSRPVKTFSIGYKDLPSFDETRYAREVATFNSTEHYEFKLGYKDILDAFPKVLDNLDEPFADSSAVPTYIVSRETKRHVTVALSGDGGDELFAGYRMYLGEYWAKHYARIPGVLRANVIAPFIQSLPDARDKPSLELIRRAKKFLRGMSLSFPERFCGWREIFPFSMRRKLLRRPPDRNFYLDLIRQAVEEKKGLFPEDGINLMLYLDVKGLLPGDMLTKVDRMSMANSLEVRVPFLDYTLVQYVFGL
ncbi:MAG: asparagine synthase (glutamine-hydrolyzing), partial [Deltaproteobacteria bacterium]|nr:asparagine synthase (glutamine-hydrolyzing) [Deltaproteobacteria bacterium]